MGTNSSKGNTAPLILCPTDYHFDPTKVNVSSLLVRGKWELSTTPNMIFSVTNYTYPAHY